jgi:hypothetical protein
MVALTFGNNAMKNTNSAISIILTVLASAACAAVNAAGPHCKVGDGVRDFAALHFFHALV